MIDDLVRQMNEYATHKMNRTVLKPHSRMKRWPQGGITRMDFMKFMAILISIGMDNKPAIPDYWRVSAQDHQLWYSSVMSRDKFQLMFHTFLHASEPTAEGKMKIKPFINKLTESFRTHFTPLRSYQSTKWLSGSREDSAASNTTQKSRKSTTSKHLAYVTLLLDIA